ncbi:hypothetical protein MKY95_21120 [Paenibacillus sp. FSL P4-0176]|uniref:hypothetical protein n=1 Tax=Paenibacillus sp. FSL P4-0176 TaxID=2921631 RepID=UPI0030D52E69
MKLIDADKLLYDLANEDVPSEIHSWVLDKIERGKYDPEDVSKIKVGDRVWSEDHKCAGKVVIISIDGRFAYVDWDRLLYTGSIRVSRLKLEGRESIPKEDTKDENN